ncbi:MAG: pyruvate dehydrogenase complex dihydrolipoamide acetyltransferase [Rhabdochlamydiaceae bacterium]
MPFTLTMPKLSPTMEEGTITKWLKTEGEFVKSGDVLFEVATDKATVEHSALDEGFLRQILVSNTDVVKVNDPVAVFADTLEESLEAYIIPKPKKNEVSETFSSDKKEENEPVPTLSKGSSLSLPVFVPEPPLSLEEVKNSVFQGRLLASPLAKKLAQEKNLDLSQVKGSGPKGRIMARDLNRALPNLNLKWRHTDPSSVPAGFFEEQPLSPMRRTIGQRLQESKTFIPHFYLKQEIDAASLIRVREELKTIDIKISVNDMIVRACSLALKEHPEINSGYNSLSHSLIRFKTIDVSVAVSVDGGLITPIVRHADHKNLGQISLEIKELTQRAKNGKLARSEYMGGSFTISNLGMFGISEFSGIINPPQAALLAVGGIEKKPVIKNGVVVPGDVMQLTLSADHRVIDGSDGARFLKTLQKYLENASLLLM